MANARPGSWSWTRILVSEQGNQVKILDTFCWQLRRRKLPVAGNSVAVIVKEIRFLRKQVTGACNWVAGKAADLRWRPCGLPGHISQKTY